jgi:hypothetical protein
MANSSSDIFSDQTNSSSLASWQNGSSAVTASPNTSVPGASPSKAVGNTINRGSPNGGVVAGVGIPPPQPSTPPDVSQVAVPSFVDSYRYGGSQSASSPDNLMNPRTLGEEDDNIASISLTTDPVAAANAGYDPGNSDIMGAYSRFFLENISEVNQEKYQVVETFTTFYAFFYGKKPPIYSYSGTLLNDENYKWTNDLYFFYDNYLRGTAAVSLSAQAVLTYDGRLITGFVLDLSITQNATMDKGAQFRIDILVTDHHPIYYSADIADLITKAQQDLSALQDQIAAQISTIKGNAPSDKALAAMPVTSGQGPAVAFSPSNVASPSITPPSTRAGVNALTP